MLSKSTDIFLRLFDTLEYGHLTVTTPDGKTRDFEGKKPGEKASLEVKDWRVFSHMLQRGNIGFAEDYRCGAWETDNLVSLTRLGLMNRAALESIISGSRISRIVAMLSYILRMNTLKGSRRNIHQHYDLSNDFYRLWLDPTMTYSSALFHDENETLEQAQHNKYDRIIDCLSSKSGSLLEVGCGWGGFAARAYDHGDFDIKGITLSEEQYQYANTRLGRNARVVLEDYRHQQGRFDHIVSIEMFEAVGERYWQTYFGKMRSLLKPGGKAVIQTITINDKDFSSYRRGGDFIRSYIFPGGMLPSPSRLRESVQEAGLKPQNEYFFGQDYARTLECWLHNFDQNRNQVNALGFDDGFVRLWRFYLAACIAGFSTGRTNVMQVELSHA